MNELISEIRALREEIDERLKAQSKRTSDDNLIRIEEACELLGLKKSTVYHLARDGSIPYYKPGKFLMFRPSELMAWQNEHASENAKTTFEILSEMKSGMRRRPQSGW